MRLTNLLRAMFLACAFSALVSGVSLFASDSPGILKIRKIYQETGKNIGEGKYQETRTTLDTKKRETGLIYWRFDDRSMEGDKGLIVKVIKNAKRRNETYYSEYLYDDNGRLIFVFEQVKQNQSGSARERRFYLNNGTLIRYIRTVDGKATIADSGLDNARDELNPFLNDSRSFSSLVEVSFAPMVTSISRSRSVPRASVFLYPVISEEEEHMREPTNEPREVRLQISTDRFLWEIIIGAVSGQAAQKSRMTENGVELRTMIPGAGDNFHLTYSSGTLAVTQELWDEGSGKWSVPLFSLMIPRGKEIAITDKPVVVNLKLISPPETFVSPELR